MESSNSTWTCWLLKAETIRVFMVLLWLKWAMFNIGVNQTQFALFVAKLKIQTSNLMKKNQTPATFLRTLFNELVFFTWNFISIYKEKRSNNLLPTSSFAKIHNKYVWFEIFLLNWAFDYLLQRIKWRGSYEIFPPLLTVKWRIK